ncbi:hypothetical protein [Actinomadura macrotermitis]|uniref:Uncharacterized protein n=1 Tax=Actinomadura macrotermitis TaxID=2585200 RepID=A0A7K0C205_9ACTN|nr:hypothetical protein [Actinomadura macrotermitis]MQY07488.1 hypothetical protein [Actinomadura macrotermitis]
MARRGFDAGTVVTGLFFLAVAGIFLAGGLAGRLPVRLEILAPAVVVGLGLTGFVRILTRRFRR